MRKKYLIDDDDDDDDSDNDDKNKHRDYQNTRATEDHFLEELSENRKTKDFPPVHFHQAAHTVKDTISWHIALDLRTGNPHAIFSSFKGILRYENPTS